jgi:hypothetical protein
MLKERLYGGWRAEEGEEVHDMVVKYAAREEI